MRFLHTSDWHLGRIFYERSLVEDQAHVLQQLIDLVAREKLDLVVVAGDIYDRAIPPTEGVKLLDWVLSELVLKVEVPVFLISGNHDSGERLGFGAKLLNQQHRLKIVSSLKELTQPLTLEDAHGKVDFHGIPYSDPSEVRVEAQNPEIHGHQLALEWCVAQLRARLSNPAVAIAHAYVAGGKESDSERPLSIGGKPFVTADTFAPFVYTALGHLHGRQSPAANVHYCGSLLPYHFSERDTPKSVSIVELGKDRKPKIEHVALAPKRKLVLITGDFDEIVAAARAKPNRDDYLLVRRKYDRPRPDAVQELRLHYDHLVALEVLPRLELEGTEAAALHSAIRKSTNIHELFTGFYERMTLEPLSALQLALLEQNCKEET